MYSLSMKVGGGEKEVLYRDRGDIGLFITLVPKFYINVILFVGLITLGTFQPLIVNN